MVVVVEERVSPWPGGLPTPTRRAFFAQSKETARRGRPSRDASPDELAGRRDEPIVAHKVLHKLPRRRRALFGSNLQERETNERDRAQRSEVSRSMGLFEHDGERRIVSDRRTARNVRPPQRGLIVRRRAPASQRKMRTSLANADRRRPKSCSSRDLAHGQNWPRITSARLWPKFEWVSDRSRRKTRWGASISLRSRPSRDSKKNRRRIYLPRKCALPRVIQIGQSRAQRLQRGRFPERAPFRERGSLLSGRCTSVQP